MPPCKSASTASKNVPRRHKTKPQHAQKNAFVLFCGPLCAFCGSFPTTEWLLGTYSTVSRSRRYDARLFLSAVPTAAFSVSALTDCATLVAERGHLPRLPSA